MRGAAGFPFKRYLPWATGTGLFAVLTWYAAEQAATQAPWWAEVPWVMVAIFFFGGFVGTLYADCINTNSSLRNWRQIFAQLAISKKFTINHTIIILERIMAAISNS